MTVDYGIDGELLRQIRRRDIAPYVTAVTGLPGSPASANSAVDDRRALLFMVVRLLEVVDEQASALRLLQDGIGDIRTEIIKDM